MDEITTETFRDVVERNRPAVIIPLGATEAHGPHLPLGTDTFQPEHVAAEVSRILGDRVLIAPTLPYGLHSSTKNMPGTIGITFDSLRSVVRDIMDSLIRDGIDRILLISGHAGSCHMAAVSEACKETAERNPDVSIMFLSDFHLAEGCVTDAEGDGHGGLIETSRMLHIMPSAVTDARPAGRYAELGYRVLADGSAKMPDGMVGDSAASSAETGRMINDFIVNRILEMIG